MRRVFSRIFCLVTLFAFWQLGHTADNTPGPAPGSSLSPIRLELARVLTTDFGVTPVLLPRGQRVGDVYDLQDRTLVATREECFRPLTVKSEGSTLPGLITGSSAGLLLGLSMAQLADAELQAEIGTGFQVSFQDVWHEEASLVEFRDKLRSKCAFLHEILGLDTQVGASLSTIRAARLLLVGETFQGKRVFRISVARSTNTQVKASLLTTLLRRLGIDLSAKAVAGLQDRSIVEITDISPVAIALRPMTIPSVRREDITLGGPRVTSAPVEKFIWKEFEADLTSQRAALLSWLSEFSQ
jgi:hypothetical protein